MRDSVQRSGPRLAASGLLLAAACSAESTREEASTTMPERALESLWTEVRAALPRYPPPALWQRQQSPPLPEAWPPTPTSTWRRYAFAHGFDPTTISDGVRVAAPFAIVRIDRELRVTAVDRLPGEPREIGIQGVKPMHPPSGAIDGDEIERLERIAVGLFALPAPGSGEESALVSQYGRWLDREGTFVAEVRARHRAFFDWVEAVRARPPK
jgi:hypothetical protein